MYLNLIPPLAFCEEGEGWIPGNTFSQSTLKVFRNFSCSVPIPPTTLWEHAKDPSNHTVQEKFWYLNGPLRDEVIEAIERAAQEAWIKIVSEKKGRTRVLHQKSKPEAEVLTLPSLPPPQAATETVFTDV